MATTFHSSRARKFARIAGLGRLGFLGFLGFLPGCERLFGLSGLAGLSGFFGFYGFFGVACRIECNYTPKRQPRLTRGATQENEAEAPTAGWERPTAS